MVGEATVRALSSAARMNFTWAASSTSRRLTGTVRSRPYTARGARGVAFGVKDPQRLDEITKPEENLEKSRSILTEAEGQEE